MYDLFGLSNEGFKFTIKLEDDHVTEIPDKFIQINFLGHPKLDYDSDYYIGEAFDNLWNLLSKSNGRLFLIRNNIIKELIVNSDYGKDDYLSNKFELGTKLSELKFHLCNKQDQ